MNNITVKKININCDEDYCNERAIFAIYDDNQHILNLCEKHKQILMDKL